MRGADELRQARVRHALVPRQHQFGAGEVQHRDGRDGTPEPVGDALAHDDHQAAEGDPVDDRVQGVGWAQGLEGVVALEFGGGDGAAAGQVVAGG